MTLELNEMTINSKKVLEKLKAYMFKISTYDNFDYDMKIKIFVDKNKDFTAFESIKYNLGFTSSAHKLCDTITSPYSQIETDYRTFNRLLSYMA